MINFEHHGIEPLKYTQQHGGCMSVTLAKDKREKYKYGDTDEYPKWRNDYVSNYRSVYAERSEYNFSILIPKGYPLIGESSLSETHSTLPRYSFFGIAQRDEYLVVYHLNVEVYRTLIVYDEWVDFRILQYPRNSEEGYLDVYVNGLLVADNHGNQKVLTDELFYFKFGIYVWSSDYRPIESQWPPGLNYRKAYFKL